MFSKYSKAVVAIMLVLALLVSAGAVSAFAATPSKSSANSNAVTKTSSIADKVSASTKVFEGYIVTILDKTTPAVNIWSGDTSTTRETMYFRSTTGKELGSMTRKDYLAIIKKNEKVVNLPGGGTYGAPPVDGKSWEAWFADEFNAFRALSSGSREEAVATNNVETIERYRQELIKLVNEEREKVGLSPYIINDECMEYSQTRANELIDTFSHTRPDGTNAGYEIIATGQTSPEGAVDSWMNSPGHKAAILNETRTYVGAGVYITSNGGCYWQMYFERDPEVYANTKIMSK